MTRAEREIRDAINLIKKRLIDGVENNPNLFTQSEKEIEFLEYQRVLIPTKHGFEVNTDPDFVYARWANYFIKNVSEYKVPLRLGSRNRKRKKDEPAK